MTNETLLVIRAAARKIIADANEIARESVRRDFIAEAATILKLLENEKPSS